MLSLVFRYEILGNQFWNMGLIEGEGRGETELKQSIRENQSLYIENLIVGIQTYNKINGYLQQPRG